VTVNIGTPTAGCAIALSKLRMILSPPLFVTAERSEGLTVAPTPSRRMLTLTSLSPSGVTVAGSTVLTTSILVAGATRMALLTCPHKTSPERTETSTRYCPQRSKTCVRAGSSRILSGTDDGTSTATRPSCTRVPSGSFMRTSTFMTASVLDLFCKVSRISTVFVSY